MSIAARLKGFREQRGLSVAKLSDLAGVSKPYIWQIESGRRQNPSGEKLQRLATALGVTIADLIGTPQGIEEEVLQEVPEPLRKLVARKGRSLGMRREDVEMLKGVHFRGRRPETPEDWELIYLFLKRILG